MKNKNDRAEMKLTTRRVYFHCRQDNRYYYSEVYPGGRSELIRAGSQDTCDREWPEVLDFFRGVTNLWGFMQAMNKAEACYRFHKDSLRSYGVVIQRSETREEVPPAGQVYGILEGEEGVWVDADLSYREKGSGEEESL